MSNLTCQTESSFEGDVWGVTKTHVGLINFIERLVFYTSNGIYIIMFPDDGIILDMNNHLLEG